MEESIATTDALLAAMIRDEAIGAEKLSPIEFANLIGIRPQLVYYYIRKGKIEIEQCQCGRPVVDVAKAREFLESRAKGVDTRSDEARRGREG